MVVAAFSVVDTVQVFVKKNLSELKKLQYRVIQKEVYTFKNLFCKNY
jgi:hypothetical protein